MSSQGESTRDVLQVRIEKAGSEDTWFWWLTDFYINGRSLLDYVREVELPFAIAENHPNLAGTYRGLPSKEILPPSRYLFEESSDQEDGKIPLLGCSCGIVGCWPLLVRINLNDDDDTVTWSDFEQPHRGPQSRASHWRYDTLGPFVFDYDQYDAALKEAAGNGGR